MTKKWDEPTILTEFTFGNLKLHEAIVRLIAIGYSPQEAHDLANEWADGLDDEHPTSLEDKSFPVGHP